MPLPIHVLLFDDKLDYCRQLKLNASNKNIEITYKHSWDNAFEELNESHLKYKFVILDARSFLSEGQAEGTEDIDSVIKAMSDIKKLEGQVQHPIPFCINTGYAEFRKSFEATTRVFEKGSETENLFSYIIQEVNQLPETKIKNDYYKIFEVFEYGYLERRLEYELINVIKRINNIRDTTEKSVLRDMRPFLEAIFSNMNERIQNFIPSEIRKGRGIDLGGAIEFIAGSPSFNRANNQMEFKGDQYMPLHIYYLTKSFKNTTSDTGMHYTPDNISRYLVLSQFNSLLEIILWYKSFMDKNT